MSVIERREVLAALSDRYDYRSARTVLAEALEVAGLPSDAGALTANEAAELCEALREVGEGIDAVVARLENLAAQLRPSTPVLHGGERSNGDSQPRAVAPANRAKSAAKAKKGESRSRAAAAA